MDKRILGRGSYGVVFKANYKEKNVAVKIISKQDEFKYSSVSRERNILGLSHENIIKILKIVETKEYGAIIMERCDSGKSLQFILDHSKNIDLIHRLKILKDIANALKFCHQNHIIHRDLKPDNLMIVLNSHRNDYTCKLFDFGCSYFTPNGPTEDMLDKSSHDRDDNISTSVLGTIRYTAPELLQGSLPTFSIDVYSFGILMWQLKEHAIPYESIKSNEVIIWQVVKNNLRPDSTILRLNEKLHGKCEIKRREYSSKLIPCRSNLLSSAVIKTPIRSLTPKKCNLSIINSNKKLSKSDFKHKFLPNSSTKRNLIRKSLFEPNYLESLNNRSDSESENDIISIFTDLLTDHELYLRKEEDLFKIENEYVRLYKDCWNENQHLRPNVEKIAHLIEKFINYLL